MKRLALALLMISSVGHAQDLGDRFNVRASLSGMYLTEEQAQPKIVAGTPNAPAVDGPLNLGYGDLRLTLDGRRVDPAEHWDLHLDGRIRVTGSEYLQGLTNSSTTSGQPGTTAGTPASNSVTTARGYLGGREYQLYEMWARGRYGKVDIQLGRQIVMEADALRLDGVRVIVQAHKRWRVAVYGGGYADPYSRSVTTDYIKGAPAFAGGVNTRYDYDKIWGSVSANVAWLDGKDDGGPVSLSTTNGSLTTDYHTENIRAWATWTNFWRPIKYLDLYNDLVVDLWGAAHTQLTRANIFVAVHANQHLTIRAGYDHLSAIAIEMYLTRLLNDRTQFQMGSIENNLTLSRTARDEGRFDLEGVAGRTVFIAQGRVRRRVLDTPSNDSQFVYPQGVSNAGQQIAPGLAYDATVSVRNSGSLWKLRPSLWGTYLKDYRARNIYAGGGLGRDFLDDRLSVDLNFVYAHTWDDHATLDRTCATNGTTASLVTTLQTCFGTRRGNDYQIGVTIGTQPTRHWYAFLDYRASIDISEGIPALITHVLVGRVEARY